MTRVLLILLAASTVAVAQPLRNRPAKSPSVKKPEAASAADFKPDDLAKLAVIATGSSTRGGGLGFGLGVARQDATEPQRLVEDAFLECLLAKGYTLAARSDVDSILREKKFQESGATEKLAASIGKVLNVPAVLVVRVTEQSGDAETRRALVGARLVNVESGAILWTGNHTDGVPSAAGAGAALLRTAVALAEVFPNKAKAAQVRPIEPKAVPKLAVLTVNDSQRTMRGGRTVETPQSDRDRQVEDRFVQVLIQKGYKLVSRTDLQAVVKEQAFQKSGLTEDNALAAGKLLNVPAILLVGVTESGSETVYDRMRGQNVTIARAAVGARFLDVASGEVRWAHAEYNFRAVANKGDAVDLLAEVAKDVAQFLPPVVDSAPGLLDRGTRLELMGQVTAAKRSYRELAERYAKTREGKRAAIRLKSLGK